MRSSLPGGRAGPARELSFYRAYGLGIASPLPLPELTPGPPTRDVTVELGEISGAPDLGPVHGVGFASVDGAMYFRFQGVGTFLVREGRRIVVDPEAGTEDRVIRLFLTGSILAAVLHQRGFLVLHASGIGFRGLGVGFLGGSRWGKSTVAAAMCARGSRLLSDDLVVVEPHAPVPRALPGFPQLKLWPESALTLGYDPEELPRLHPELEKRARRHERGFEAAPLPLRVLYVLANGESLSVEPLTEQESVIELVRHSYFVERLPVLAATADNFRHCGALAKAVKVRRLMRTQALDELSGLARMVEADLETALVPARETT